MTIPYQHTPVMAREVVDYLAPAKGKVLVDCTLGGGGHAEKVKSQKSKVKIIGFDQDAEAITAAKQRLAKYKDIEYVNDNFSTLKEHLKEKVDGFLFDLGVSSYQLDEPGRGFSIREDGPLDMRMDKRQKLTAFDIVNTWPAAELTEIFKHYGEERFAKRVAEKIRWTRDEGRVTIATTAQLKELIEKAIPTWKKRESVTRVFQALRIAVNRELDVLQSALNDAVALLKPGGRIVVLAYHSLEDRIVKRTFNAAKKAGLLTVLTKKPLTAAATEIALNPRAASAKLRAGEKR
ncbi:MAG: 16S rRNA (cytosine(1402)-N(4))-methyltransferase RsmH [Candidatus Margulisbacteria bacterium]|jgi:16S rRNA (cytosine1402-N4)-methyltransferase|nr:16S rRNA (cytosine(1402)-N(4))-methyltransferase RsmH [Candidatus Margulisiibacteriota bacterium]